MTKANLKRLEEGKLYYSISEVCSMTGLEQHVLRYWESEFPQLRPKKNRSGNRAYRAKEIKIIRYIKYLLYEEMYTIPGAKKKMADANMADLDGQLTLLRVPAALPLPARAPEPAPESRLEPAAESAPESGDEAGPMDEDSHAHDGGDAAARLREELKRVKNELQSLLTALASAGEGIPLNLLPASHLVSTHIRGFGHALFHVRDNRLEFRRSSSDELAVDGSWINKTGLVAEGLASQPYIHLDIRTPFGETVGAHQVQEALAESLGPRKDRYRLSGWHIQFVEDTNLGSNHRVFADLADLSAPIRGQAGMDAGLSLELAVEALGELVAAEKGEQNFQLLYGGKQFCYSLLYLNGSPFHVLRVDAGAGPKAAARLRRHRDFAPGSRDGNGRNGGLRTFLLKGDPLWEGDALKDLKAEPFELPASAKPPGEGTGWLLHLGLAHAARQRDFSAHNRVAAEERRRNDVIRTRFRFFLALGAAAAVCALAAGAFGFAIHRSQAQLSGLKSQASVYQAQVDSIRALRKERMRLEASVADLRPLWHGPMDWSSVLGSIGAALPREAGIDGLSVTRQADGSLELSFRAWVRDWNQVQAIQKKLSAGGLFTAVSLSEQRKDLQSGVVVFHVTSKLERN